MLEGDNREWESQSINQSIGKLFLLLLFVVLFSTCKLNINHKNSISFAVKIPSKNAFEISLKENNQNKSTKHFVARSSNDFDVNKPLILLSQLVDKNGFVLYEKKVA